MRDFVLLVLGFLYLGKPAFALVGGAPVSALEAKQLSGIVFLPVGEKDWCTATRISKTQLLLAAHCITERRGALKRLNQDVRIRPRFAKGSPLSATSKPEVKFPIEWEMELKVVRAEVPVEYHYSSYEESEGLPPETTADIGFIEVEGLPDSLGIMPITRKQTPPARVWKLGYGCETDVVKDLAACQSGAEGEIRRLKRVLTPLAPAQNLYLVSPGKESNGEASLSYYDSGGPLLEESDDGKLTVLGVNSRGIRQKEILEREAILFDLHTSLFSPATREWLEDRLANPGKTKAIFAGEVTSAALTESPEGWQLKDRVGRPVWQKVRSYLIPEGVKRGRILFEEGSLVPKAIAFGPPGLGPPRKDADIVKALLERTATNEFTFSLAKPTTVGYLRLIFEKPTEEPRARFTVLIDD